MSSADSYASEYGDAVVKYAAISPHVIGWISPEGEHHALPPDAPSHEEWAQKHSPDDVLADTKEPFLSPLLLDRGWVRVAGKGQVQVQSLQHPQARKNLKSYLNQFPRDHEVVVQADNHPHFKPRTAGEAVDLLERGHLRSRYNREYGEAVVKYSMIHEGLLRGVAQHQHDTTPSMVFADYLDENGDPYAAQIIREHCNHWQHGPHKAYIPPSISSAWALPRGGTQFGFASGKPSSEPNNHTIELIAYPHPSGGADNPNRGLSWKSKPLSEEEAKERTFALLQHGHRSNEFYQHWRRVSFSTIPHSIYGSSRHKSGLNQTARLLQKLATTSTDPQVWTRAVEALEGKLNSLHQLQDHDPDANWEGLYHAIVEDQHHRLQHGYSKRRPDQYDRILLRTPPPKRE